MVFFFGGGWKNRSTKQCEGQSSAFAAHGYVAASVEYRRSRTAQYPAAITDAKAAMRWMRAHATEYGIDPDRILVGGGSSGGHLAALVATTPGIWEDGDNRDQSSAAQGVLLLNPVTDLRDPGASDTVHQNLVDWIGGTIADRPADYQEGSPAVHVSSATAVSYA